ncbi:MAG: protein kinase [Myxococcales bacterium]|nr:protein kinase [Myxococcales bacterium]
MDGALTGRSLGAGAYRVGALLGQGAMGAVYEGVQEALGRTVAIKVLHAARGQLREDQFTRFQREARAAAALGHPNIIQITDFQWQPGEPPFLVMERLVGQSLGDAIQRGRLRPQRVAFIASQVLAALGAAHAAGIVHRDIKPDNVFLTVMSMVNDIVKVLDFGVAKLLDEAPLTMAGAMVGSPAYMPPEQALGGAIDARADLYAVGATMYHALSGRLPIEATDASDFLARLDQPITPLEQLVPDLDPGLTQLVGRAMAKRPEARFASAEEMRAALRPWAQPQSASSQELLAHVPSRARTPVGGGFGTGSQAAGFGTGSQAAGFGTGSQAAGFGTGSQAAGFGTGSQAAGFGTGSQAAGGAPGSGAPFATGSHGAVDPGLATASQAAVAPSRAGRGLFVGFGVAVLLMAVAGVAVTVWLLGGARDAPPTASDASPRGAPSSAPSGLVTASTASAPNGTSHPPGGPPTAPDRPSPVPSGAPSRPSPTPTAPSAPPTAPSAPSTAPSAPSGPAGPVFRGCTMVPIPGRSSDFTNGDLGRNTQIPPCTRQTLACKYPSRSFGLTYQVSLAPNGTPTAVSASKDNMGCAADFCLSTALRMQAFPHVGKPSVTVVCSYAR